MTDLWQTLRAMEKKQSTFLAQKEWLEVPWEISPKSSFDSLLDIVIRGPEMMRRGEHIGALPIHHRYKAGVDLFGDCSMLYKQVKDFYTSMAEGVENPLYSSVQGADCLVRYEFVNVDVAATLVMIWAYSLMIKSGLRVLSVMLEHFQKMTCQDCSAKFNLEDGEDLAELANNILLSVDYCVQNSSIEVRSTAIMAPLAIVIEVLRGWPQYQEQYFSARNALESISKMGFKMVWPPVGEIASNPP